MQDVTAQVLSPHSAQPFPHPSPPEGIIILMLIVSFTCVFHLYYFCNYLMALKILCFKNEHEGVSLVAQWLRICLLMQGTRVRALVWEDPTCHGATKPVSHNY